MWFVYVHVLNYFGLDFDLDSSSISGEESAEESAAEVRPPSGAGATPTRRSTQHTQARGRPVQQGASSWRQGEAPVRDERWTEESAGDQGWTGQCTGRVHQHHQRLLSRRNRQVSHRHATVNISYSINMAVWLDGVVVRNQKVLGSSLTHFAVEYSPRQAANAYLHACHQAV